MKTQTEIYDFNYTDSYGDNVTREYESGRVWYRLNAGNKSTTFYVDANWPQYCEVDCQSSSEENKRKFQNALRRITGVVGYRSIGNYYGRNCASGLSVYGKYSLERI